MKQQQQQRTSGIRKGLSQSYSAKHPFLDDAPSGSLNVPRLSISLLRLGGPYQYQHYDDVPLFILFFRSARVIGRPCRRRLVAGWWSPKDRSLLSLAVSAAAVEEVEAKPPPPPSMPPHHPQHISVPLFWGCSTIVGMVTFKLK